MQAIWVLVNTCITPIITYASETWTLTKQEEKQLNQILDKIIRRILMTPDASSREAIYIETGLLDIKAIADSKRMNMKARLNRDNSQLMEKVLSNPQCKWTKDTTSVMTKYGLTDQDLLGTKYQTKNLIKRAINKGFNQRIDESGLTK